MRRFVIVAGLLAAPSVAWAVDAAPAAAAAPAYDEPGPYGLGGAIADYGLGLTGKLYLPQPLALQATIGVGYAWLFGFAMDADLLWELPRFLATQSFTMNPYIGAGVKLGVHSYDGGCGVGACQVSYGGGEVVGGVGMQLKQWPIEAVLELKPILVGGAEGFGWFFGTTLAVRYFFK